MGRQGSKVIPTSSQSRDSDCSLLPHPDFRDGRVQALPQFGLTSRSFACHRVRIVCRRTVNPPFRVFAQVRVKPGS